MKNFLLILFSLSACSLTFATCTVSPNEYYTVKLHVNNRTPHQLKLGDCVGVGTDKGGYTWINGNPTIAPHEYGEFGWTICTDKTYSTPIMSNVSCPVTDIDIQPNITVNLLINYPGSCNDFVPGEETTQPLITYSCSTPNHTADTQSQPGSNGCYASSGVWTINNIAYFDIIYYPSYTLTWNNIGTNLTKGQVMANKLGNNLLKAINYDKLSQAAYNDQTKTLIVQLDHSTTNPYEGLTTGDECKAAGDTSS